jgi:hypothetical protein
MWRQTARTLGSVIIGAAVCGLGLFVFMISMNPNSGVDRRFGIAVASALLLVGLPPLCLGVYFGILVVTTDERRPPLQFDPMRDADVSRKPLTPDARKTAVRSRRS